MKENSNPFQPALAQPADDSALNTDNAADDFVGASKPADNTKPPRTAISLDGISRPTDPGDVTMDNNMADSTASTDNQPTFGSDPLSIDPIAPTDETAANGMENSAPASDSPLGQIAALTDDNQPTSPSDTKPSKDQKQPKQFTISILTIIFFVLALAGIAGTVWFYMENQKNTNSLADANAKVEQLTNESADSSTSENKTADQFNALQDKVADLTKQNQDKQKTIDDLTKTNEDLKKTNEDLTKKAQNISDLTTRVDTLLNKLNSQTTNTTGGQSTP